MIPSSIRTTLSLPQARKDRWIDPELSVGKYLGVKKRKYHYWEAEGPAREAFEQIKPQITAVLESACAPVPGSRFISFNIFMIGETRETAVPNIMFSCEHPSPRKIAMNSIKQSKILDQCRSGIGLGQWSYPPHLKNLRFLASSKISTGQGNKMDLSLCDYNISPASDTKAPRESLLLQIELRNPSARPGYLCKATIGGIIELSGKRFYLAPAHVFSPQWNTSQDMLETYPQSEDSDCEFGVFDDENESPVDDQEADFMSQYSFTPESSHPEQGLDPSCTESSSDVALDAHTFEDQFESQMNSTITADEGVHHLHRSDVPALSLSGGPNVHFQSDNLDYCLIEVGENDHYSSNLPVLSQANIGQLENRDVRVTASTGSGNVLNGILSGRPSCIRLPSATRFIDVLSVQLEDSLQPGDSGSIIRDANTGKIYGHIIAGDTESQNALIVPARDVLADVIAISRRIEMVSSPFDLLSPKRSSGVHTPVPGPKWRKSIKHPSAANHYSGHPHPVYHESMRAMQTYSGDPPRPQYTLGFSMWISAPQQAGQIDEVLHAYTRLQGDQNHRGIPLEYLSNWRSSFPAIATIVDDINNPIDCDIILLEVNLDLMTDFPPAGSRLGIQLDIDYGHPSAGDVLGVGQMDNWTCRTHIYQDGQSLINSHHQLTKTQSTKVKSLFELSWWAKIFTQLTQEKRTAEDSGLSQAAQDADDYIRHFFHSLSAVQELRASSPNLQRLSNQYQGHGDDRKRMALLAWTFRQTRPGEVGTTTWRRLLPARDRITANSP